MPLSYVGALLYDPATESVAIDRVRPGHTGVAVAPDKLVQYPEPELPGESGLLDKAHFESARELHADTCGHVDGNLGGEP